MTPSVEEAERLQGFPAGWTEAASAVEGRKGTRWRLVGNAVTVGVSTWLGRRLRHPGEAILEGGAVQAGDRWPPAAFGSAGKAWAVDVSMWPTHEPYQHLADVIDLDVSTPLSVRGTAGFLSRARRARLRFAPGFLEDVAGHLGAVAGVGHVG